VNFLFHMFLSGDDPELLTGNFMGDFVKGPLGEVYPPRIRQGLLLHRKIDSFAQRDADFQASRLRLSADYGLYRGVLVDLFYDHFLALGWRERSEVELPAFLVRARGAVEQQRAFLPPRLQGLVPVIFEELLPSYHTVSGIGTALGRMSKRIGRPNPLAGGEAELVAHYGELRADFERFTPKALQFASDFVSRGGKADLP